MTDGWGAGLLVWRGPIVLQDDDQFVASLHVECLGDHKPELAPLSGTAARLGCDPGTRESRRLVRCSPPGGVSHDPPFGGIVNGLSGVEGRPPVADLPFDTFADRTGTLLTPPPN
ncbi:hypothetical protein Cci01nite_27530 [Catellatospora citrea]|uniref:Uncharacterized protein n=1 Tax=Catellatospora citrea TaxID=53366 RepID=A0A8J3KLY8_9ACTN|nr:hypothetical protein Cci01nite_27530 [Catellatospora citrea]